MSDGLETGRITIARVLTDGDNPETNDLVRIEIPDDMSAVEALGLLEITKDYVLHDRGEGEHE